MAASGWEEGNREMKLARAQAPSTAKTALSVAVTGWAAWTGGAWLGAEPAAAPTMLRRRVSPLGQQALRAAWSQEASASARLVFSSRHGEFARTLSIMDELAAGHEVSPADFTLSVHHALAGLLSIARGNRLGHTAIAAGDETLFCALLEAAACLAESPAEPVVLVHYDEPLPAPFDHFSPADEETVALALTLAPGDADGLRLRLSSFPLAEGAMVSPNPGGAFLDFLTGAAPEVTIHGDRLTWRIERLDAAA
jgi:hypothetical protein